MTALGLRRVLLRASASSGVVTGRERWCQGYVGGQGGYHGGGTHGWVPGCVPSLAGPVPSLPSLAGSVPSLPSLAGPVPSLPSLAGPVLPAEPG